MTPNISFLYCNSLLLSQQIQNYIYKRRLLSNILTSYFFVTDWNVWVTTSNSQALTVMSFPACRHYMLATICLCLQYDINIAGSLPVEIVPKLNLEVFVCRRDAVVYWRTLSTMMPLPSPSLPFSLVCWSCGTTDPLTCHPDLPYVWGVQCRSGTSPSNSFIWYDCGLPPLSRKRMGRALP